MDGLEERQLVAVILDGDKNACDAFVRRWYGRWAGRDMIFPMGPMPEPPVFPSAPSAF